MHEPLPLPEPVRERHAGWDVALAWSLVPECATWRLARAGEVRFAKVARSGHVPSLAGERDRLAWAAAHLPVPTVLDAGGDASIHWMVTAGLPGVDAARAAATIPPEELVPALAAGLRAFHAAPIRDCPFRFDLEVALPHVRARVANGLVEPERHLHPEYAHLSPEAMLRELEAHRPATEDLVLCHGDYCLPNVLLEGGRVASFLDLGELGVADRWWDLAAATWSVTWNLGPGWEDAFLRAYGVERDAARLSCFRMLYDLAS
ncbi:aminoglycoside 3'-phosphotransferase [bacterium]|nr:aminoglycoside 3'-phosphotransferase [bacterium]